MKCPIDQSELKRQTYESFLEIDKCPECHGIWLDKGELEKAQDLKVNDYSTDLAKMPNLVKAAFEQAKQLQKNDLKCPSCNEQMFKKEASIASQVIVDKCSKCFGFWLNKGELEALEIFFERHSANTEEVRKGIWAKFGDLFS